MTDIADAMVKDAVIDESGRYRYTLYRRWNQANDRTAVWVMLNPSTADHIEDDPTIRRCIGFSKAWGYGALTVVNLFALRATNPRELLTAGAEAVGPANDQHIYDELEYAELVIAAWGSLGAILDRHLSVRQLLRPYGHKVHHLGLTQSGHPRHPLYLRSDIAPVLWTELLA